MPDSLLSSINHIVVLMLENRSFDHMLGFLYSASGNVSPAGNPFEGLTGTESNPDSSGAAVPVSQIQATNPNAYYMPGADPGEGYSATNSQLFGNVNAPVPPVATNRGFVTDFNYTLGWEGFQRRPCPTGPSPAPALRRAIWTTKLRNTPAQPSSDCSRKTTLIGRSTAISILHSPVRIFPILPTPTRATLVFSPISRQRPPTVRYPHIPSSSRVGMLPVIASTQITTWRSVNS